MLYGYLKEVDSDQAFVQLAAASAQVQAQVFVLLVELALSVSAVSALAELAQVSDLTELLELEALASVQPLLAASD